MEAIQENKVYHFVYFIESHDKSKRLEVVLPYYKNSNTLELVEEKDSSQIRNSLISRVFRFKIFPDEVHKEQKKPPYKFVIIIKDKNNAANESQYTIKLRDIKNDFYEYNLKMDKVEVIPLSYEQQFNIYVDILRNKLKKKQGSKESDEFIMSTQLLFAGVEKKFDFLFYLLIFLECFTTKIVHRHLMSFKPEKIQALGVTTDIKMKQLKNILNLIVKKPEKIRVENENSRNSATELFYFVALFFDMNFQKEKLNELLGDEKIFDYLCARLIKYQDFLKNLILANNQVCTLIEKSKDFNEILISLFYVGKDFINFLQVINNKWTKIRKLYDDELNKEDKNTESIDTEKYIIPKQEDDMMKLKEEVEKLNINEKEQMIQLIKFSPSIFERYEEYNKNKNFLNLSYLNDIFNIIRKMDKNFKLKIDDTLVHETGLNMIKEGKLKNEGVLDFICKDIFYNDKKYKTNKMYRPLDVFDGIDISSLNDNFYNYWEKINFKNMFESQITDFSNKIASLVREVKDFGLLFKLFKIDSEEPTYDYGDALRKRFIELLNTYSNKTCPNFIDDTSKLIYIVDKKKINPENFLKDNIGQLNAGVVNDIYINIANSYPKISRETKNCIVNYIIKTQKPSGLIKFLKECKNFRQDIFSNLNKFNFQEKDFFTINENDNYSFIKGLIKERIIDENSKKQFGNGYVKNLFEAIQKLRDKIEKLEVNYSFVNVFIKKEANKKFEEILLDRLLHIYFLNEEKAKQNFEKLKNKMGELNIIASYIQSIMRYLVSFFSQSKKDEIKEVSNIFRNIKQKDLNYYDNNLKNSYENYFNKYYQIGVKSTKNKYSAFFNEIYKESKNKFSNDEQKCLDDAENNFYEFRNLFEKNGIYKINQHTLEVSVRSLNGNENELKKEIEKLGEIFEIEGKENYDEIYENLLLISQKEYIFNVANAIINFIEKLQTQKTKFSNDIKEISDILINKKDINNIKKSKEILYQYGIDISNKDNNFINILLKLKQQPDSCILLSTTTIQDCRNLQELSLETEDNFVTVNDILDMEKCIEFLGQSKDLKKQNDLDVISSLTKKASNNKDISIYFEKFVNNYSQIRNLQTTLNKSEMLKYQIYALFDGATFTLTNKKEESFLCVYKQKEEKSKENKKRKEMTYKKENIIDLKTRTQLSKKMTSEYRCFIESANEILNISNILQDLSSKGYPKTIKVKIILNIIHKDQKNQKEKIDDDDEFIIKNMYFKDEHKKNDSKEIIDELKHILSSFILKLKKAYEKKSLIRAIYGRQYNLLYDNFRNQNNKNNKDIIPLLKYITNDMYKKNVNDFIYEENDDNIDEKLNDCERFLNEILKVNNIKIEDIYEKSLIKKNIKEKYKGVFTFLGEKLELDLFKIFKYLTGSNPIAQNILICKKETTNEEINAFLYRAIKCPFYSCFIIGGLETLEFVQKSFLIELLDYFFQKGNEKINSCLIFLYTNRDSDINKNLEMKRYRNIFNLKRNVFENEKYEGNDIKIVKSDKSGVGKSTQIKLDIYRNNKEWIYFPFGGVVNKKDTIKRLKELNINKKSVIHLDLYDTDQTEIMMEFLFSILITRCYGQEEDIFYLSKDIEIKIEIPNSFINFFEKFPILNLFEVNEMKISNLPPLLVPKELDSNIQIVANYLKSLLENRIDKFDLIIPNVTPADLIINKKTPINAIEIPAQQCQKLIFDTIKEEINEPTYYQIISFINVLAVQLKKLNQSFFLNAAQLLSTHKKINHIRTFIVKSFIKITKHFTEGAFTNLLKGQEKVHKSQFGQYDEGKDINKAVNDLANYSHEVISYEKIDPSLLFFHEGEGESFSIITNKNPNDQEYKSLLELKNSQAFSKKELLKNLPKYSGFDKFQFLEELKNILDIKNPVKSGTNSDWKSLEEITGNYVFTADNFVKMVLILLRIRSNIPVIMMGETGCGKTSLIRKLSEMKNNGKSDKMKILNIHAGTNDNDIINFINEEVIPEANKIEETNKEERKKRMEMKQLFEEIKLWVFLDEINTCKSMGLISELMCKHTCQGKPLPSNIVFIAACNPYRQRENKGIKEEKIGLDINQAVKQKNLLNDKEKAEINKSKSNNLVYTVNPLPHSLLNFVFDFGNLTPKDEEDYIRCIIKESIEKIYFKEKKNLDINDQKLTQLKNLAGNLIIEAHNFIRKFNDRSAGSLREIRRFNIFYEFFYTYLTNRKKVIEEEKLKVLEVKDNDFYEKLDDYSLQIYSINLSVFVCYYLRITDKEKREKLLDRMNKIFNQVMQKNFYDLPLREENFIVNNIKLDKGIAKNRALLENIFSLFVAINNKVPIFIVGKPGCSKSLSFQLLNKSMQGSSSESPFLKNYPKLMVHSYQGSLISTSKGVENIFIKARSSYQKLSDEDKKKNISMIYFDEMGLAEHSPNNPLKVIHSELEYDQNEGDKKIAFVGISNWVLDASKMNRGISISIPEPNEDDNKETSLIIGKSYSEQLAEINKDFYENLGLTYFKYKDYLKTKHNLDGKEDFHGNRDFYHLVKNASRNMIGKDEKQELNEDSLVECGISSIERNFAGLQFNDNDKKTSLEIFKNIFKERYPNIQVSREYDVVQRIKENINDLNSRYLLIISKSSLSSFLLSSIISEEQKEYSICVGSKFKQDSNSEEYSLKILNKMQTHMENGDIIVLNNLEAVYPAMYDLFNQNFTILGDKNYARLAIGNTINTFSLVNNNFRCIINVDLDKIDNEETPFLNRFEKHIISFEYLLSKDLIQLSQKIKSTLDELIIYNEKELKGINYDLSHLLINCNLDEIQALIYNAYKHTKEEDEIIHYILSKISLTLPQDIILIMNCSQFKQKNEKYFNAILECYGQGIHNNFSNFLAHINNKNNVVYTFSNIFENINLKNINNEKLGPINENNIEKIQISSLKSENELERILDNFFEEESKKVCLIQFLPYEVDYMNYIKYFIEDKEKSYNNKSPKYFILVVYLSRVLKDDLKNIKKKSKNEKLEIEKKILGETLSYLSGYYQIFIDNLNGDDNLDISKLMEIEKKDIINSCINVDMELMSNVFTTISYMRYNIFSPYKGLNEENYINRLMELISNNKLIRDLLNDNLLKQIVNNEEDLIKNILKDKNVFRGDEIDILSLIKINILKIYKSNLNVLFFRLEKDQFFSSLLTNSVEGDLFQQENPNNVNKIVIEEEMNLYNDKEPGKKEGVNERKALIQKMMKFYLENLNLNGNNTKITEKPRTNKVDIMFGFKLPGIKSILDDILKMIRESIVDYRKNEDNLRGNYENDEKMKQEIKNDYFNKLDSRDNSTINMIGKEEKLLNIIENNKDSSEELYNLIKNDYYTLFLNHNLNKKKNQNEENEEEKILIIDNLDENKIFLDLMVKKREQIINIFLKKNENEKEENIIKLIAKTINFVECYSDEISSLEKIFSKLNMKIPELNKQINDIIDKNEIIYEVSDRNPEFTIPINKVFFLSIDSILRVIISNSQIYEFRGQYSEDDLFDLINTYKEILQDALKLENNLILRSKEVFSLEEILKLFDAFNSNKIVTIENFIKIIEFFSAETYLNNDNNHEQLCNRLNEFYQFLVESLGQNKDFNLYKVLSYLFVKEYIKISFEKYRELLLEKILNNNDFIANSSQFIGIILENALEDDPKVIRDNLSMIKEKKSPLLRKINNAKNEFLDQVVMNILERKISVFFELIPELDEEALLKSYRKFLEDNKNSKTKNLTGILFGDSFEAFQELIQFLDKISTKDDNEENNKTENMHLCKLYAIVFIKMYLSKLVYFMKERYKEIGSCKQIMDVIKNIKNENLGRVIKIYIFKLLYSYLENNYEQLKIFNYNNIGITFGDQFNLDTGEEEVMLSYFFLPLDKNDYNIYKEESAQLEILRNSKFNDSSKKFIDMIKNNDIDIFVSLTINKIISNLGLNDYLSEKNEYQLFCTWTKNMFNLEYKINENMKKLFYLFYDDKTFMDKMRGKLLDESNIINQQLLETLLYGFRFCINTLNNDRNEKCLYRALLQKDNNDAIKSCYIPGCDIKEDLHLETLETIEMHFKLNQDGCGCYVCSCGYYYNIDPCGFPTRNRTSDCPVCHQKIGYGPKVLKDKGASNHGMVIRDGHYRIFKDAKQKVGQMSRWKDPDENIPNMLLDDYIKKVIEPIRKKSNFGFNSISRDFFENQNKKVRNLSNIGYRLLNFISYCHLFYGYCLGYISEENLKKNLIQNMTIIKIIQTDWILLKESLQKQNISSIQIFMNMIFKKLSQKIKDCTYLTKSEDRDKFEKDVEKLIEECIKEYPNYRAKYEEENKNQLKLSNNNIKVIITELVEPNEENYKNDEYPMFKYFILTKYKTQDDFVKRMDQKPKYPLINQLLQEFPGVKKLRCLPDFNEFTNYMVENYSFRISREDAKRRILKEEEISKSNIFKEKFKKFISSWNEVKVEAKKYKCRPEMQVKNLEINDKLIYFLNDNGELGYGMYLAAACQNFIEWQNMFLQPIIDANNFNGILHNYVDTMQKKVPVQEAKPSQILLIHDKFESSKYTNLNDIIYTYSERNIFNKNGKINYSDYNSFTYDYDAIEEELGKILLTGVCLFEGEDELNFVTFWSEGFRGGRSQILSSFYLKYPQKDLDDKEKVIIMKYIDNKNKDKMAKNNMNYDFKEFFGSLQMLIFYLTEQGLMKIGTKIKNVIKNAPSYLKLSVDCNDFFNNDGREITIQNLMNLFFYFEHLCFEDLADTLQNEYKKPISDDIKNAIINKLLKNYNNNLFTLRDLGAAVRRFISRYLAGNLQTTDVGEDRALSFELSREDLWEEKIGKEDALIENIDELLHDFNLNVGQAYAFYQLIGEEDKNAINQIIIEEDKNDALQLMENNDENVLNEINEEEDKNVLNEIKVEEDKNDIQTSEKNDDFSVLNLIED